MKKILLLLAAWVAAEAPARAQVESDCPEILGREVADVVARHQGIDWHVGAIVGAVTPSCTGVYYFGKTSPTGSAPNSNTAFRIGSMTKSYTGTLLAYYSHLGKVTVPACRGSVVLPINPPPATTLQWLLNKVSLGTFPLAGWRAGITLEELGTHTSGLPRKPTFDVSNNTDLFNAVVHASADAPNSGGDNTATTWTAQCPPSVTCPGITVNPNATNCGLSNSSAPVCYPWSAPGTYLYSNFGFGVLGQALAHGIDNLDWITAVDRYILAPLGMNDTFVDGQSHSAVAAPAFQSCAPTASAPYNGCQATTEPYPQVANPAGALWSTGPDQMRFLNYMMGIGATSASQVLYGDVRTFSQCDHDGNGDGLGWSSHPYSGDTFVGKDGDYNGFHSQIGYLQNSGIGLFVMINSNDSAKNIFDDLLANL